MYRSGLFLFVILFYYFNNKIYFDWNENVLLNRNPWKGHQSNNL